MGEEEGGRCLEEKEEEERKHVLHILGFSVFQQKQNSVSVCLSVRLSVCSLSRMGLWIEGNPLLCQGDENGVDSITARAGRLMLADPQPRNSVPICPLGPFPLTC